MPRRRSRLGAWLWLIAAGLGLAKAVAAEAPRVLPPAVGLGPAQLAVVVNERDPLSLQIGEIYTRLRGIPIANLIRVEFDPGRSEMHPGEFAVLKRQVEAQLPAGIQGYALAWAAPYRVGCMSITAAFALGYDRAYCAQGCKLTRSSTYVASASTLPFDDTGLRPAMMLAATSAAQAEALIRRGIAADGSMPQGSVYLVQTADRARSSRGAQFDEAARRFGNRIPVQQLQADALRDRTDVLLYQTGAVSVPAIASNRFLPGAVADHLTSFGGQLTDSSQMSALRWLEAGATGSYGTVVEPCAFPQKFPNPVWLLEAYLRGETLLEAYWKSVLMPGQGVFIGEPLARPFAGYRLSREGERWWVESPALTPGAYNVLAADDPAGPFEQVAAGQAVTRLQPRLALPPPIRKVYRLERLETFGATTISR